MVYYCVFSFFSLLEKHLRSEVEITSWQPPVVATASCADAREYADADDDAFRF